MEIYDVRPGALVYLKHMRFADDHTIDYRMNGRPYLVFKVEDNQVGLLKMGTDNPMGEEYYYKYVKKNHRRHSKKAEYKISYIDLRNLITIPVEELVDKVNRVASDVNEKCKSYTGRVKHISDQDWIDLNKKIDVLCASENFKKIYNR